MTWSGVIRAYREYIPITENAAIISLNEGNTPLIQADRLAEKIAPGAGLRLFLKYEGLNPTGSFKDRGMTAAVTRRFTKEPTPLSAPVQGTRLPAPPPTRPGPASAVSYWCQRARLPWANWLPAWRMALKCSV